MKILLLFDMLAHTHTHTFTERERERVSDTLR